MAFWRGTMSDKELATRNDIVWLRSTAIAARSRMGRLDPHGYAHEAMRLAALGCDALAARYAEMIARSEYLRPEFEGTD